jgi:hypothetical protein
MPSGNIPGSGTNPLKIGRELQTTETVGSLILKQYFKNSG